MRMLSLYKQGLAFQRKIHPRKGEKWKKFEMFSSVS